jgi:hypothetical protein
VSAISGSLIAVGGEGGEREQGRVCVGVRGRLTIHLLQQQSHFVVLTPTTLPLTA